jgi:hypothetical protein
MEIIARKIGSIAARNLHAYYFVKSQH